MEVFTCKSKQTMTERDFLNWPLKLILSPSVCKRSVRLSLKISNPKSFERITKTTRQFKLLITSLTTVGLFYEGSNPSTDVEQRQLRPVCMVNIGSQFLRPRYEEFNVKSETTNELVRWISQTLRWSLWRWKK